jgi:hypothetical protein
MMCYACACYYYCLRSSTGTIVKCIGGNCFTIIVAASVSVMTITIRTCPRSGSI